MRNTIITLLAAVVAVAAFTHSANADVTKSRLGDLRRTDYVVTDVTGGGGGGISNLDEVVAIVTNYDAKIVVPRERQTVLALKPRRLGPYLWEIGSEGEDWNAATNRFAQAYPSYHPGCSGICTSRFHGRNLDWNYDRCASVLVRSAAREGKYASIGLVDGLLPDAVLESGIWTNAYLTLPFSCGDGINEKGVSIQQNVVPRDSVKSATWRTYRSGCVIAFAIVRYALDRCATAREAADLICSSLFIPDEFAYDFHYLVSDRTSSYIVEDGHVYSEETCPTDVMTNFRVGSASYNDDRTVKWETVEPYGIGLERYDHVRNASHDMTTVSGILLLMKELWYTRAYNIDTSPYWYTEHCDPATPELTVMAAKTNQALFAEQRISWYADYLAEHNKTTARYRGGKTWQTTHTAVFDRELLTVTLLTQEDPASLRVFRLVDDRKLTPDDVGALPDDYTKLTNNTRFTSAVASVSPPAVLPEKWALADVTNATGGSVSAKDVSALPDDYTGLKQNTNFSSAVAAVSPKVVLPDKWALANVTNATGNSVSAEDVSALPDDYAKLTSNTSFTSAVSYAAPKVVIPEKWALANVTNAAGSSVSAEDIGAQTKLPFTTSVGTLVTNYTISVDYASEAGTAGSAYYADEAAVLESPDGLSAIHGDGKWITRTNETAGVAVTNTIGTAEAIGIERQRITPISEWKTAVESHLLLANESETTLKTSAYFGDKNNQLVGTIKGEIADWAETGKPEPVQYTVDLNNERTALTIGSRPSPEHTPEWSPALTYSQNDLVKTGNVVYICTVGPSASVQPSSWVEQASFWREVYAGAGSTVFGATNTASGYAAHAEGGVTHADGTFSHAEGIFTRASGLSSHAEGTSTLASGRFSHAEGTSTTAHGLATHAEGSMADALGLATHAEGLATRADGIATHAEGNRAIAIGNFTHAEGAFTLAGSTANTNGTRTSAGYGSAAHAAGYGAVASNQTAFVWQGAGESVEISQEPALTNRYYDHGAGTFNINPVGGLEGIYIGETNLAEHLKYAIPSVKADRIVAEDGLSEILADGTWVTRTNAVTGTVETNRLATQRWVGDAYQPKGNYLTEELDPNVSISGDTVTIHGTSKTFLTSHQSLDNYWTKQDTIPFDKIQYKEEILLESDVRNQLTSTESDKPLSANMGRELKEQIDNIKSRGRFLSLWNSQTGLPYTEPSTSPYVYKTGDYFIVGGIDTSTNYRPSGTNFVSGVPSSSVETNELSVNDTYYFDGTQWSLLHAGQKEVAFSSLTGSPYDNANLSTALTQKRALSDITNAAGRSVSAGDVGAYTKEETETRLTETGTRLTDGTNEIRVDRSVYEKQTAWELSTNTVHASDYDIVDLEVYWNASNTSYGETNVWILIGRAAIIPGGAKSRISSNAISDKNTNAVSFTVRDDIGPNPSVVTAVRGTWRKVGTLALTREIPSSYSWTKVTDRPDSLAGYGITNTVDFSAGNTELVATVDSRVADVVRYETAADGSLTAITAGTRASAETAPEWSAASSYLQGDVVRYGSVLYVCVAGPKETVGPSSWESQSSFWKRAFVGPYSVSIGVTNTVSGIAAQGIGSSVHADGNYAHAEGVFVRADGQASHAEGSSTRASGRFTHAEGISTTAGGLATHAEGSQTEASGVATHAEGLASSARGLATHASGNATTAVGYYTDARGSFTTAGREAGTNAVSSADGGAAAQASGYGAVATNQTAFVWQGVDAETEISQNLNVSRYYDHGAGTFNLNPVGGLSGIYIGETNLADHLTHAIPAVKADRITAADGLSEINADGTWVTRTNATEGVAETNYLCTVAAAQEKANAAEANAKEWVENNFVQLVADTESGLKTAVTIGSRIAAAPVGKNSFSSGSSNYADGYCSVAIGESCSVYGVMSIGLGACVSIDNSPYTFAWNGNPGQFGEYYRSHGQGTFNVNPVAGLSGFFIGETSLADTFSGYRTLADNNLYEEVVTASALTSSTNAPSHTNKQYRVVGKIATVSGEALNHMVCDARTNTAFDCRCLETNLYAVVSPSVSSNYVTKTTTINNKPLSGNVSLTYTDVNALSSGTTHLSGDVPTSRTINGKSLTSNITLQSSDVGAQSEEAAAAMRKSLVNGEVIATRSQTADYYRSGKSGELGYGYAYTVVSGGGTKRLGAYVPDTVFVVEIEASSDNDPLISYYGSDLVQSACARTITALDYDDYDNPGRYSCVTATYTPTNGAPYVLTVANNGGTSTLVGLSASSASWIELYTGGTYHYLYDFYVDSYAMTLSYTDQYYDPDTWQYLTEYRTVHFAIYSGSDLSYEFVVFGNLGTYSTPEDVDTRVGTYIQSHAIQRTVLKERTGKDGELGDGWGYMVYDWTSDMRSWQINIPSLVPSASYTATRLPFYGTAAYGIMYPANPIMDLGFTCGPIVERVKSTHEKFSTTNVRYANAYIQGWGFPGDTGSVETPLIRIDVDNLTHGSASYSSSCKIDGSLTNQVYTYDCAINGTGTYYGNYSNEYHCVMSNFRATNNGLTYDNDVVTKVYRGGALTTVVTNRYYPVCGFTLTRNANSFRSVTTPVEKVATISTAHLFWDPGLKCTWQLAVTNGCFFMEKVSNEDLTRKDQ